MSRKSKNEYLHEIRERYHRGLKEEKQKILDDPPRRIAMYVTITGSMRLEY